MKKLPSAILLAFIISQPSCGMKKMATDVIAKISNDGMVAVTGEEDIPFARESTLSLIKILEVLKQGDSKNALAQTLLSQAYGQYAFGFLEEDLLTFKGKEAEFAKARARADLFYKRGRDYGLGALNSYGVKNAAEKPFPEFKSAIAHLGKKTASALFWTAFNWASYLNLHMDSPEEVANLPRIEAMLDRAIALSPEIYYGSARAFKGVLLASRPKMLGGNLEISEKEFKEAISIAPNYLMTKVLFAQYYARQIQDQNLFQSTLKEVVGADASLIKNEILANELAKRRATILLSMQKQLF